MNRPLLLVVDASPNTAARVAEAMPAFAVEGVRSGAEAEDALQHPDLVGVIAAIQFPKGNGYELCRLAKQQRPALKFLLLCGGFEVYQPGLAQEVGVDARLQRPFQASALQRAWAGLDAPAEAAPVEVVSPVAEAPASAPAPALVPAAPARPAVTPLRWEPSAAEDRVATWFTRTYPEAPPVRVDPEVISPALERAIVAVLPEVVEAVLEKALIHSPGLQALIAAAVEEAARAQLQQVAQQVIRARLAEIEAQAEAEASPPKTG